MKLTIIGCSGSMSGPHSPASAYLVETDTTKILLDFGPGAMGQLLNYADPADIDAMVLSHLHADHCVDIVGMQVYRRWYPGFTGGPIPVYSPGDGLERTRGIGGDGSDETYAGEFDFRTVTSGQTVTVGDLTLEFFDAVHPVPAVATRITGPAGEIMAYSGDTDVCPGQIEAARDADLYLCEAAFEAQRDTVRDIHLTGERAGQLAAEAGVKELVLTHLQPWTSPQVVIEEAARHYEGLIAVAAQGATFEVEAN